MRAASPAHRSTRRQFITGGAAFVTAFALIRPRSLLAARTTGDLSSMGYPSLSITITNDAFDGVPEETAAGRYLIATTNSSGSPHASAGFISPRPMGMSAADLVQVIASLSGVGNGAPTAIPTMVAGGSSEGSVSIPAAPPTLVIYQMYFAGGAGSPPVGVIDLQPGEYVIWGDDREIRQKTPILRVTGAFPAGVEHPEADITAILTDSAVALKGDLTAGKRIIRIRHRGTQPHFLAVFKGPDTMTKDQVMAALGAGTNGTQPAGGLTQSDLQLVFYGPTQSSNSTTWHPIDLQAGTYVAYCSFPTVELGRPSGYKGVVEIFKVTG